MSNHSTLDVLNLSLSLGPLEILHRVSLSLRSGEIVAVTGESGSGKSMTALAVMGLLPTGMRASGQILLDGGDMLALSEPQMCALRGDHIGMIFQEPMTALNPLKTIGDQVLETILIHRKSSKTAARARAQEVLIRVGLPPEKFALSRYPHQLSGGQRQRVVIAMAIALRPKFLIADEPTTALDVTTQAQILALLKDLVRQEGMGLMMITHDLAVVSDLADQILIMRQGEVVEQGPTGQLFAAMSHPYTRMLFKASNHTVSLPVPAEDPVPLLQVQNVARSYQLPRSGVFSKPDILRAVDNVSFTLHAGERLGLVGESGCGKSTLTRAILGLEQVQAGTITLKGVPVWSGRQPNRAVRRNIQVVFQDPYGSFNPRHTVARLITEPYHLLDKPPDAQERAQAVEEALQAVGLSPKDANKYSHEFSGGQRQRLAIARALILRPDLIVFDEAVSALDVSVRAQILDLIADLSSRFALSYLFISHDLSVVRCITDRVMVMRAGIIVEDGPTDQVLRQPRHAYTQSLLVAAPKLPALGVKAASAIET